MFGQPSTFVDCSHKKSCSTVEQIDFLLFRNQSLFSTLPLKFLLFQIGLFHPPTHFWGLPQKIVGATKIFKKNVDFSKRKNRGTFPTAKQVLIHFRTRLECFNLEPQRMIQLRSGLNFCSHFTARNGGLEDDVPLQRGVFFRVLC